MDPSLIPSIDIFAITFIFIVFVLIFAPSLFIAATALSLIVNYINLTYLVQKVRCHVNPQISAGKDNPANYDKLSVSDYKPDSKIGGFTEAEPVYKGAIGAELEQCKLEYSKNADSSWNNKSTTDDKMAVSLLRRPGINYEQQIIGQMGKYGVMKRVLTEEFQRAEGQDWWGEDEW